MAMVPIGLARLIEDLGLDAAIVQNKFLTSNQIAALGGLAVLVGIGLMVLYTVFAGAIADFYDEPRVAGIIRTLSLVFVLDALQIVPRALLQKELRFGILAIVNGAQLISSALILALCAYLGLSYWALVLNHVLGNSLIVLLLFVFRRHPIGWPRHWQELAQSVRFGASMLIARIAWYGYSNADQAFLGRAAGADALGAYGFSMTFARVPVDEVSSLSGKVVPGIFSAVQNSARKLTRYLLMITEATSYVTVPATVGLALVATDFVPIALGPQWYASILPLQILAVYACTVSITTLWSHILIWTGHANLNMFLNLFALAVLVPAFYFGSKFGIEGVALALAICYPITLVPNFWFMKRIIKLPFRRFLICLAPAFVSAALMAATVTIIRDFVTQEWTVLSRFSLCVAVGAATYLMALFGLFGIRVARICRTIRRSI
jgi:PST family polysaccharide transporter